MKRARRRPTLAFRVVAMAVLLGVAMLLGEGIARLAGPSIPYWQARDTGGVIMVGHPTRLWGMATGVRQNAGTTATINASGLRGPLPEVPRPRLRERVMITGDSSFFGHGVPDDATSAALLAGRLRAAGIDAETVNASIPGYSTEQTRLLLDEVAWAMEPTLLVVANLWSDFNFDHFRDADLLRTQRTFYQNPLARSAFFQVLAGGIDRLRGGEGARIVTWTRRSAWPEKGTRRVPVTRYAENLDAIVRDARARDIGVVFLAPTNRDMARGGLSGDIAGEDVRRPYFDAQAKVAAHHGLPVVDTLAPLTAAAVGGDADPLYVDEMHPSAAGNAVIAEAIAATLKAAGWPTNRLLGRDVVFDTTTVADTFPGGESDTTNPMSPQVNLFPRAEMAGASMGPTPPEGTPDGGTDADAGWVVSGTVRAPPGPIRLELRSDAGDALATSVLDDPGPFTLRVGPGNGQVRVVATAAAGTAEAKAVLGGGAVVLVIGE